MAWEADLRALETPVLIVTGDADVATLDHSVAMFRLLGGGGMGDMGEPLPASRLAVLPATSHTAVITQPARRSRCIASEPRARQNGRMSKKRNRRKRQETGSPATGRASRSRKERGLNGVSVAFIAVILLAVAAIAIAIALDDRPDCPPGLVWSESHGHCH
jgi:hypothetical protein